ncbi:MAG TPA: STAS domain-containing protein [Acidimicrobiia bacterium]|jgi:anti-anti-sigma factor
MTERSEAGMVVSHEQTGGVWRVRVSGDVDLATARALEHELDAAFRSSARRIDLDLVDAVLWDGSAFGVLADAAQRAERDGIVLALVGISPTLRRVLDVADLPEISGITDLTDPGRSRRVDGEAC